MIKLEYIALLCAMQLVVLSMFTDYYMSPNNTTQSIVQVAEEDPSAHARTDVYYWLHAINLQRYSEVLYDNGFRTLTDLSLRLNTTSLNTLGIEIPTHRMAILSRLFILQENIRRIFRPRTTLQALMNVTDAFYDDVANEDEQTKERMNVRKEMASKMRGEQEEPHLGQFQTTIVTAFFADPMAHLVERKHPMRHFYEWFVTLLEFPAMFGMHIYTDEKHYDAVMERRQHLPAHTKITLMRLADPYVAQRFGLDEWHETWFFDKECSRHSWPLYMIWNEKSRLVLNTARSNPFNSSHFFWMDIGYVRRRWALEALRQFPHPSRMKIVTANGTKNVGTILAPFEKLEIEAMQNNPPLGRRVFQTKFLANCFGGGGLEVWEQWNEVFYSTMDMFLSRGWYIGKDQIIMNTAYLRRPELWTMITPRADDYFFILGEMSNRTTRSTESFMGREYHPVVGHRWSNVNQLLHSKT